MLPLCNLNELLAIRPTGQRVFNFLFAPSVLVAILLLMISRDAPLALGIKGMTWLFFFLMDQETRTQIMQTSDTSAQITAWVLFFSYVLMMWWTIIAMFADAEKKRQRAKDHEPARSQQERPLKEGSGPSMLFSLRILARITLWEAVRVAIAFAFLNFFLAFVLIVPQTIILLVLDGLGISISTSVIQLLVLLECWLLSALLVLFAYNVHCSSGRQL
jgi:hypothetical protein